MLIVLESMRVRVIRDIASIIAIDPIEREQTNKRPKRTSHACKLFTFTRYRPMQNQNVRCLTTINQVEQRLVLANIPAGLWRWITLTC